MTTDKINSLISSTVKKNRPDATVILYGSRARGEAREDSDWDVIVVVDEEKIDTNVFMQVGNPLYDLAMDNGIEITPIIYTRKQWDNGNPSMFKHNVTIDGIVL